MTGSYMIRTKRLSVPKKEFVRDYDRKDLTVADYILPCDYDEELLADD